MAVHVLRLGEELLSVEERRALTASVVPQTLPKDWRTEGMTPFGHAFRRRDGLLVLLTASLELDGKRWVHLSVSRKRALPTWPELVSVRNVFFGSTALVVQVLPPASKHVNLHPFCLHLWRCLDGDPVPDFTRGGNTI